MLFREFKQSFFSPDKEILINKAFKIWGRSAVLAAITSQKGSQLLWLLYHYPKTENDINEKLREAYTNRSFLERSWLLKERHPVKLDINLWGYQTDIKAIQVFYLYDKDKELNINMVLQHFMSRNVDMTVFDDKKLSELALLVCNTGKKLPIDEIPKPISADITLKIPGKCRHQYIGDTYVLPVGTDLSEEPKFFCDSENGIKRYFYINRLERYDVWKEFDEYDAKEALSNEHNNTCKHQNMSDKQNDEMRKLFRASREKTCPRGFELVNVVYETDADITLNFYDKEYLDRAAEPGAGGYSFSHDTKIGPHGLKQHKCTLIKKPVPKNFSGNLTIELLSADIAIPEETIVL